MWRELDNNLQDKHHSKHDRDCDQDIDINININVNNDNATDWTDRHMGGRIGDRPDGGLNLCDVAAGIGDIAASIRGGAGSILEGTGTAGFKDVEKRRDEPPFIDCEWGRLLDRNKEEMVLKAARLGAQLKESDG